MGAVEGPNGDVKLGSRAAGVHHGYTQRTELEARVAPRVVWMGRLAHCAWPLLLTNPLPSLSLPPPRDSVTATVSNFASNLAEPLAAEAAAAAGAVLDWVNAIEAPGAGKEGADQDRNGNDVAANVMALVDELEGEQRAQGGKGAAESVEDEDEGDVLMAGAADSLEDALSAVAAEADAAAAGADAAVSGLSRWASAAFDGFLQRAQLLLDAQQARLDAAQAAAFTNDGEEQEQKQSATTVVIGSDPKWEDVTVTLQGQPADLPPSLSALMLRGAPLPAAAGPKGAPAAYPADVWGVPGEADEYDVMFDGDEDDDYVAALVLCGIAAAAALAVWSLARAATHLVAAARAARAGGDGYARVAVVDEEGLKGADSFDADDLEGAYLLAPGGGKGEPRVLVVVARGGGADAAVEHYRNKLHSASKGADQDAF
jgi:hypothetical protein